MHFPNLTPTLVLIVMLIDMLIIIFILSIKHFLTLIFIPRLVLITIFFILFTHTFSNSELYSTCEACSETMRAKLLRSDSGSTEASM